MASNTGLSSPGEELMTRSTSAVAFSRSSAASRSRESRAIFVSFFEADKRVRAIFDATPRLALIVC
jgi:hypothetical protein